MARAAAMVEDLEQGSLPLVCAKTGRPADGFVQLRFTSTPAWTWILLLFGILPFLIAQYFATERVLGLVPMSDVALRRAGRFRLTYRTLLVAAAALLVLAFTGREWVLASALIALLAGFLVYVVGWPFFYPTGQVSGEWVWLRSVDARFADELERWYARRR